jgi:hypothetical protein
MGRRLKILLIILGIVLLAGVIFFIYSFLGQKIISPTTSTSTNVFASSTTTSAKKSTTTSIVERPAFTIEIKGDEKCQTQTTDALKLIETKAPSYYDVVIHSIGVIDCQPAGSGMYWWEYPPRFQVGEATREAGTMWYAGAIVHDSCHSKQHYEQYSLTDKQAEAQCIDFQIAAMTIMGADQETLDYLRNAINTNYWDVDYGERWW